MANIGSQNGLWPDGTDPLPMLTYYQIDGSVQERRNSIANALELRLSCTNPSKCVLWRSSETNLTQSAHELNL